MSDSLAGAIDQRIRAVVLPLEESGVVLIDPNLVADRVVQLIDPTSDSPELAAYCATMDLRQRCRKFLARRHDPVEKAKAYASLETADLFSGILQDYYPARRAADEGDQVAVYVRRDSLSRHELAAVAKRMRKAGSSMIEHADALDAFAKNRAA